MGRSATRAAADDGSRTARRGVEGATRCGSYRSKKRRPSSTSGRSCRGLHCGLARVSCQVARYFSRQAHGLLRDCGERQRLAAFRAGHWRGNLIVRGRPPAIARKRGRHGASQS